MNEKILSLWLLSAGLILFPVLMNAQPETKLLRYIPPVADSGIASISKKNIQQLETVPVADRQRLIIMGTSNLTRQASVLWLAKKWNKKVYQVNLSQVISKYIGETEKNLDAVFADARAKGNILFLNEGDELFGKRTAVRDSHDKYANQEVSYLMSRIEKFEGLLVLASNRSSNDSIFLRQFKYIIKTD